MASLNKHLFNIVAEGGGTDVIIFFSLSLSLFGHDFITET